MQMKARHICAVLGIAAAAGAVVFTQSLVATNDAQAVAIAERLFREPHIYVLLSSDS